MLASSIINACFKEVLSRKHALTNSTNYNIVSVNMPAFQSSHEIIYYVINITLSLQGTVQIVLGMHYSQDVSIRSSHLEECAAL